MTGLLAASLAGLTALAQAEDARTRNFDADWRFHQGDVEDGQGADFDSSDWRALDLPHDWSIEGPKDRKHSNGQRLGYVPTGIGWYRKSFELPENLAGQKVFITFGGVFRNSEVWINGESLGKRPYGYSTFQYDLTPHLEFGGNNLLAVRVDNSSQPNSRWYTGSGIYRSVELAVTDKLHVKHWGTTVTTPEISDERATVKLRTEVRNEHDDARDAELVTRIVGPDGQAVASERTRQSIPAGEEFSFEQSIEVPDPQRWGIETPLLYRAESVVRVGEQVLDRVVTEFGIREIALDKDRGFLLNGEVVKMKGVNLHHDGGSLGAAVPLRAWERRLEILKSIGCNAIRTSHNPPSTELLKLCDRMGFVVIDEAFDKWGKPYNRSFPEWGERDLKDMIRRDRNHPSVVMWSVGNELTNQGDEDYLEQLEELVEWCRETDPTRPVTVALRPKSTSGKKMTREVVEIASRVDAISCNYQEQWFDDFREADPEILVIGSEIYPYFRGEGDNYKAFKELNPWLDAEDNDYVLGSFYWTGIDYLGEAANGWPFHGWNGSLIDTCGHIRAVGHLAKSFWDEEPMVRIAVQDEAVGDLKPTKEHWGWPAMRSHWTLPKAEGRTVKVFTFTNCPEVELFANGESLGRKKLADFPDRMIAWEVPYEPGVLEARGIAGDETQARHELRSAGEAAKIRLRVDRESIAADGRDLAFVDVVVTDKDGIPVPGAKTKVEFVVEGPGRIIGVDNGDLTSMESYKGNSRSAYHGRAQAIVQSTGEPGRLTVTAKAEGLEGAEVRVGIK